MLLPPETAQVLAERLNAANPDRQPVVLTATHPLPGGSVNNVFRLETNWGPYCLKLNTAPEAAHMFPSEAEQLGRLQRLAPIRVPVVEDVYADSTAASYLLLEYLAPSAMRPDYWARLGRQLAKLHQVEGQAFGGVANNFIATLPQPNLNTPDWATFFAEQRILPMAKRAYDAGALGPVEGAQIQALLAKTPSLCPEEPPVLLHGDLWKGNVLVGPEGYACLIDPALYFGHREADLAMTLLFGGYEAEFYQAYQDKHPLQPGFERRFQVYNLYPLLVHLVLFGDGYLPAVQSVLRQYS